LVELSLSLTGLLKANEWLALNSTCCISMHDGLCSEIDEADSTVWTDCAGKLASKIVYEGKDLVIDFYYSDEKVSVSCLIDWLACLTGWLFHDGRFLVLR